MVQRLAIKTKLKMAEGLLVQEQEEEGQKKERNTVPNYEHPVYREISHTNGTINKMKKDEVKRCLIERGLDSRWVNRIWSTFYALPIHS